jgi:hypothetical protein
VDARAHDAVGALERPFDLARQRVDVAGALLGRRGDQAGLAVGLGEAATAIVRQPQRAEQIDRARPVGVSDADGVRGAAAGRRPLVGQLLGADPARSSAAVASFADRSSTPWRMFVEQPAAITAAAYRNTRTPCPRLMRPS